MCASPSVFLTRDEDLAGLAPDQQMEKPHFFTRSKGRLMQNVMVAENCIRVGKGEQKASQCTQSGVIFTIVEVMQKAN